MWYGSIGKIARINLSTKNVKVEDLDKELSEKYIGSVGIAGKILFDKVPPLASPYDPVNLLIFATESVTGTNTQTALFPEFSTQYIS